MHSRVDDDVGEFYVPAMPSREDRASRWVGKETDEERYHWQEFRRRDEYATSKSIDKKRKKTCHGAYSKVQTGR